MTLLQFPFYFENLSMNILRSFLGKTNHHDGNVKFRQLVSKYKKDYVCAKRSEKRQLVNKIILFVRQRQGRFLQKDSDGFWYEIGNARAHAKLAQSMREGTSAASICRKFIENGVLGQENPEAADVSSGRKRTRDNPNAPPHPKRRSEQH